MRISLSCGAAPRSVLHARPTFKPPHVLAASRARGIWSPDRVEGCCMSEVINNAFARRDLLRLAVGGAALGAGPSAFAQSGGTPKRGGKLTIAADADPIGLDATTTTAYSS